MMYDYSFLALDLFACDMPFYLLLFLASQADWCLNLGGTNRSRG